MKPTARGRGQARGDRRRTPGPAALFPAFLFLIAVSPGVRGDRIAKRIDGRGKVVYYNIKEPGDAAQQGSAAETAALRQRYVPLAQRASEAYKIPVGLILAVMEVESDFDPKAVSSVGAMGLMQLMPETAEDLGIAEPFDPESNVFGGARLLKRLIGRFEGNLDLVLAAYNAGETAVARCEGIPPIAQTERFVKKVLSVYRGCGDGAPRPPVPPRTIFKTYVAPNGVRYFTNIDGIGSPLPGAR